MGHTPLGSPSDRDSKIEACTLAGHGLVPTLSWHMPPRQGLGPEAQANCPAFTSGPVTSLGKLQAQVCVKIQMSGPSSATELLDSNTKIHGQRDAPHFPLGSCKVGPRALLRCLRSILPLKSQGTVAPPSPLPAPPFCPLTCLLPVYNRHACSVALRKERQNILTAFF